MVEGEGFFSRTKKGRQWEFFGEDADMDKSFLMSKMLSWPAKKTGNCHLTIGARSRRSTRVMILVKRRRAFGQGGRLGGDLRDHHLNLWHQGAAFAY